ncbi:MAG: tRNA (cytidine(34)-2'-O)-methyltransferase [Armatimonadaceae bacterium]
MKYPKLMFHVVLIEPEIPANTGNIGRTCVGLWSRLHLVGKLGFEINDRQLRRAGLDYWSRLEYEHHPDWDSWWSLVEDPSRVFFLETQGQKPYFEQRFRPGDWLVFGRESQGLPESVLQKYASQTLTIPCPGDIRSLNLSNAVSMVVGEGIRQNYSLLTGAE